MRIRDWFKPKKGASKKPLAIKVVFDPTPGHEDISFLFISVSETDVLSALESWSWLPIADLTVFAVSAFGEIFFRNESGEVFQIDTIEGLLSKVAINATEFTALLQDEEGRDKLLLDGFVIGARSRGLVLEDGECYDFKIAPILGGPMEAEQIEKTSFVVKLYIAGQIHEQVKGIAPGTPISKIIIDD